MKGGTRPNAGRKARSVPVAHVHIKVEPHEKAGWVERAQAAGMKLSEWVRARCSGHHHV